MSDLSTKLRQKLITMLEDFRKFCAHHQLLAANSPVLLTVSGGIDSVVMVDLFQKAGFEYAIAHCNFQLRGEDANEDEAFVKKIAEKNAVNFYNKRFDTLSFASEKGISTQMAARELRYQWFREICMENKMASFATAHHLNDSLETILLNLSKGTGFSGLKGISIKAGDIIRPLLFANRECIEKYAHTHEILWREDSSNLSTKYQRNLLRHKVIPVLSEINNNLMSTFVHTQERLQDTSDFLQEWLINYQSKYQTDEGDEIIIDISELKKVKGHLALLFELLKAYGFNYIQTKLIDVSTENGKIFYSHSHSLSHYNHKLIICPNTTTNSAAMQINDTDELAQSGAVTLQLEYVQNWQIPSVFNSQTAFLNKEQLVFPLTLRPWQQGDYFCPIGMDGKKKLVSDLLNDLKIPANNKYKVLVLCSLNKIVWVAGLRVDDRYKGIAGESVLKISIV